MMVLEALGVCASTRPGRSRPKIPKATLKTATPTSKANAFLTKVTSSFYATLCVLGC